MASVVTQETLRFQRPNRFERLFNRAFGLLVHAGFGFSHNYVLQVRGRKSGKIQSTPVDLLLHNQKWFLVAPRGFTQWVRNARVSGEVILKKGTKHEAFFLRVVPDPEKPEILKAYLDRFRRTVQRYFPVSAGSPAESFVPFAARYPTFELFPKR
jgi:deazaflavin-dependent oxidoreductase (nitroreductase family)